MVQTNNYDSPTSDKMLTRYRMVDPLDPDSFEPSIVEIAESLANINRYNGHTSRPYSVAEHSINCYYTAMAFHTVTWTELLFILLHDAAEAYLSDVIRPLKRYYPQEMLDAEDKILENLIDLLPISDEAREEMRRPKFRTFVKCLDSRMASTEMEELVGHYNLLPGHKPYPFTITPLSDPRGRFLELFDSLINMYTHP